MNATLPTTATNFDNAKRARPISNDANLAATLALRAALNASQKSVEIQIATADLEFLKSNDYMLCFAKKVAEGAYNVVWQSYTKFLVTNDFSWTPQYQLFGTNTFKDNVTVSAATNLISIGLGEQCTLDSAGVMGPASSGGAATALNLINNYGPIHPGVNQLSYGLDGNQVATPIYVAQNQIALGSATLTPVEMVLVWFEQNIQTSTMFSTARSNPTEIDLTFSNTATRLYSQGVWTTP